MIILAPIAIVTISGLYITANLLIKHMAFLMVRKCRKSIIEQLQVLKIGNYNPLPATSRRPAPKQTPPNLENVLIKKLPYNAYGVQVTLHDNKLMYSYNKKVIYTEDFKEFMAALKSKY